MGLGVAAGSAVGMGVAAAGNALRAKQVEVSYKLDAEYGGNATTLPGGMTETTAYGLMQDVGKALGI